MKSNEWAKTLLHVYKYLDRVTEGIDKMVSQNAYNSFYTRGDKQGENGIMAVADRIINLSARKVRLINTKVLCDKALLAIDKPSARLLIERYMDNDEADIIAERHGFNVRTYFRKLFQAEVSFCQAMSRMGFNENKLSDYLNQEKWIIEVYEKFKNEKEELKEAV